MTLIFFCSRWWAVLARKWRGQPPPWANARSPAAPARSLDVLHHLLELLEVDLTVAVLVDLADRGLELLLRVDVFEILAAEELPDFLAVDFA